MHLSWVEYNVHGHCIDMPNEPPETVFKDKIRHKSYPCQERAGVIWVYMGNRNPPPPLPELEWTMVPDENRHLAKRVSIVHERPVYHDGRWGKATLEVCLAILKSARERREVLLADQVPVGD